LFEKQTNAMNNVQQPRMQVSQHKSRNADADGHFCCGGGGNEGGGRMNYKTESQFCVQGLNPVTAG